MALRISNNSPFSLLALGVVVGVGGAFGAALFHLLIALSTTLFYGHNDSTSFVTLVTAMPWWQRVLIPTLGGLCVGVIYSIAKVSEAEGEGVPEVMEALAHKHGTIRPIVAPLKIVTAALTLGSGGSAGREGPVIQIGSAIGSSIAQLTKQASPERSLLLAAGAAAAIGGTFGAPIAGILFTIEILHHKTLDFLRTSVIISAAFIGAGLTHAMTGHTGLRFPLSGTFELSTVNMISLLVLGLAAALIALLFGFTLSRSKYLFKLVSLPMFLRPAIGGFLIGLIGLSLPYIHEPAAYPLMIDLIALASLPLLFLIALLFIKMLATGITLWSGGSGGIFAPLLLMGAITGSILASTLVGLGFEAGASLSHLIVIGMAVVFAAAAHAPLTASFITYEMTGGDPAFLVPLLFTCLLSTLVAKHIRHSSVYAIH